MATVEVESQWVETFQSILKDEINSPTKISRHFRARGAIRKYEGTYDADEKNHLDAHYEDLLKQQREHDKKISEQREMRMARFRSHFVSQPKLETICQDWVNDFVDSGFTTYKFCDYTFQGHRTNPDDLKYMIYLGGRNLTELSICGYPNSQIMPLIKSNCKKLEDLYLKFEVMESKDFEDVFSNMSHLKILTIDWQCKDPTLPMTLVKSIEQVRETLTKFTISCESKQFHPFGLPDSSIEKFSQANEALMTTVENMKNLECLTISWAYGVTDEFLIKLFDNAKNLKYLCISGSRITDKGIIALDKLNQLESFSLDAIQSKKYNKLITDESIQRLFSRTINNFDISNCIHVTNSSVIELFNHLPNLRVLHVENTQVNLDGIKEIAKLKKSNHLLKVYTSFKINDDIYESLCESNLSCVCTTSDTDNLNED